MKQILEFIKILLPVLKKRDGREIREFSELITGQYEFLATQLEKVLKDYFEMSAKVHEMHAEMLNLKTQLSEAIKMQCLSKECTERDSG